MQSQYMIARYKEIKARVGLSEARTDDVLFLMAALDKANRFIEMHKTIVAGREEELEMVRAELKESRDLHAVKLKRNDALENLAYRLGKASEKKFGKVKAMKKVIEEANG